MYLPEDEAVQVYVDGQLLKHREHRHRVGCRDEGAEQQRLQQAACEFEG